MVHDEGHDPGGSVLRRISDHTETAHHFPLDQIIVGAARRIFPLSGENLVVVTMVRNRLAGSALVSLRSGMSHQRTKGTWLLVRLGLPIEAIALSLGTNKL